MKFQYVGSRYVYFMTTNKELTPGSEVYDLVGFGERERILQTCLVLASVMHTHPPLPALLWHEKWIGYLV
jgi:hypothetical protein